MNIPHLHHRPGLVLKMSAFGLGFSPSPPSTKTRKTPQTLNTHHSISSTHPTEAAINALQPSSITTTRRTAALALLAPLISPLPPPIARSQQELQLREYVDAIDGFSLLIPSSYTKVDKAGANALFEEINKGTNNVGVVVTPVRLANLREFGTPEFVADKLIQAEKRKESTKSVELIGVHERTGKSGVDVYEFEYEVDSTRGGMKRIFTAALVSKKKLYLLNIAHSDKPESPLDSPAKSVLEQVLHSFDAVDSA